MFCLPADPAAAGRIDETIAAEAPSLVADGWILRRIHGTCVDDGVSGSLGRFGLTSLRPRPILPRSGPPKRINRRDRSLAEPSIEVETVQEPGVMSDRNATRRGVLKGIGATAAAAWVGRPSPGQLRRPVPGSPSSPRPGTPSTMSSSPRPVRTRWRVAVSSSTTSTGWQNVIGGGPTGPGNSLYGADVTDDGTALWFVGASGAIGEYDVESGVLTNRSAPMDVTNSSRRFRDR